MIRCLFRHVGVFVTPPLLSFKFTYTCLDEFPFMFAYPWVHETLIYRLYSLSWAHLCRKLQSDLSCVFCSLEAWFSCEHIRFHCSLTAGGGWACMIGPQPVCDGLLLLFSTLYSLLSLCRCVRWKSCCGQLPTYSYWTSVVCSLFAQVSDYSLSGCPSFG